MSRNSSHCCKKKYYRDSGVQLSTYNPIYLCVIIYSHVSPVFYSKCFVLTISLRYVGYYILCITILNVTISAKWTHSKLWHACLCIFMIISFLIFRTKKRNINFLNDRCSKKLILDALWHFVTIFLTCFWNVYRWKYHPILNDSYLAIPIRQVNLYLYRRLTKIFQIIIKVWNKQTNWDWSYLSTINPHSTFWIAFS